MAALRLSPAILHRSIFSTATIQKITTTSSLRLPKLAITRRIRRRAGTVMMDTAESSYPTALSDLAKLNGILEATMADLEKVVGMFSDSAAQSFFTNPTISIEKNALVIGEITESSNLKPHTANFLNIVVDMNRIDIIKDIYGEFEVVYNKITGTEMAVVSSVVKMESQHLAQIAQAVQRLTRAKNVRIKTVIDPSLVAGFTIRYGSSGSKPG